MASSKKRRWLVGAGLASAMILALVWLLSPPKEPSYQGQPLSYWASQVVLTTTNMPYGVTLSAEAVHAIQGMGTNALPTLLQGMREETWRYRTAKWLDDKRAPRGIVSLVLPHDSPRGMVIMCFQALGPEGEAAVPTLARMLQNPGTARPAVRALCAIGKPGAAALREALPTNPDKLLCANIFNELYYGVSPEMQIELAPMLAQSLKEDSEYAVSMSAATILGRFTNAPAIAVPALAAALRHKDGGTRAAATRSLLEFGANAATAIPQLESTLNDVNYVVRFEVTNTLSVLRKAAYVPSPK